MIFALTRNPIPLFAGVWTLFWAAVSLTRLSAPEYLTFESLLPSTEGSFAVLAGLLLYAWAAVLAPRLSRRWILFCFLSAIICLLAAPPIFSSDLYSYAARGSLLAREGLNPYYIPPAALSDKELLGTVFPGWLHRTQAYGPLWSVFSALLMSPGWESFPLIALRYQIAGAFGMGLCALLIAFLRSSAALEEQQKSLALFCLNPLLLLEFINNAHNDVWMSVFGLSALAITIRGSFRLLIPLLLSAALIKYAYLAVVPAALLYLKRTTNVRTIVDSIFLSIGVLLCVLLPFYRDLNFFNGLLQVSSLQAQHAAFLGPPVVCAALLSFAWGSPVVSALEALWLGRALYGLAALWILRNAKMALSLQFEFLLIGAAVLFSAVFLPWYITWWLPLCALRGGSAHCLFWTAVGLTAYPLGYTTALPLLVGLSLLGAGAAAVLFKKKIAVAKAISA